MKRTWTLASVVVGALCLQLSGADAGSSAAAASPAQREFLVAWAMPEGAPHGSDVRTESFASLREAALAATGGLVLLDDGATWEDLARALWELDSSEIRPSASDTVIGIDYDGASFVPDAFIWTVTNSVGCSTGLTYSVSSMPPGWDSRVSSAQAFAGCNSFTHYSGLSLSGDTWPCTCASMSTMNNRTRSERWTP